MGNLAEMLSKKAKGMSSEIINQFQATSVQYAVMHKDKFLLSDATGVFDKRGLRPLDTSVMYGSGSVAKAYAAASVMYLSQEGKVDIDKPYKDYVPEFEMSDERYKKITVRMLLNHSSGIYGTHFKNSFLFEDVDTYAHDNLLSNLKKCRLRNEPGAFSEYCNDGFQLIELLVEKVSKSSYIEFLEKTFFKPLGIKDTKASGDESVKTRMARFYNPNYEASMPLETTNLLGTGGLVSTAEDMCRFGKVLMGKEILNEGSVKKMESREYEKGMWISDEEEDNFFAYGLGWDHVHVPPFDKFGIRAVSKGGDTGQYHAILICLPEHDLSVGVLSSGGSSLFITPLATELLLITLKELAVIDNIPPTREFTKPQKEEMPDNLQKYSGLYGENGKLVDINIKEGKFKLPELLGLIPPQKYVYIGDGKFASSDGQIFLHFVEEANGLVFLQADIYLSFPNIGVVPYKSYLYQKLDPSTIDPKIAEVWKKRAGRKYLLVDDKFSSPRYESASPLTCIEMPVKLEEGYACGGCRIIDENYAQNVLYFRDCTDLRFFTENNAEYLVSRGSTLIRDDCIETLKVNTKSITISENGFTEYYKIPKKFDGKKITVKMPAQSAFATYNKKFEYKNLTTITGLNTVELAKGDYIAFIGSKGATFELSFE